MFSKVEENREIEEVEKIDIPPFLSVAWGAHSPVRPAVGRHSRARGNPAFRPRAE